MSNNFEIAKRLIEALYPIVNCGIFNTRNIAGDTMQTLYDDGNGFSVEVCYDWAYFEIFGLSDREFSVLKMYYSYMVYAEDEEESEE